MLSTQQLNEAVEFNRKCSYPKRLWLAIQREVGTGADGLPGPKTAQAIYTWQLGKGLVGDGKFGPQSLDASGFADILKPQMVDLTVEEVQTITDFTIIFEGGRGPEAFGRTNDDTEWKGRFDEPDRDADGNIIPWSERRNHPDFKPHRASQYHPDGGFHVGVSVGSWQATQRWALGDVVVYFGHIDPSGFVATLGGNCAVTAKALAHMLTSPDEPMRNHRTPRVQPLSPAIGELPVDLWEEPWRSRWRDAAQFKTFRDAQRHVIASKYLAPVIKDICLPCGITSQAALAVLFDIRIQFGGRGLMRRVRKAWGQDWKRPREAREVLKVVEQLPEGRQPRRHHIWRQADQLKTYTEASLREFAESPPYSPALERQLWRNAQR